jgi:hypothetical protein
MLRGTAGALRKPTISAVAILTRTGPELRSPILSKAFKDELAKLTQQNRRAIREAFRAEHGDKRIGLMHEAALPVIVSTKTPAAQRNFRRAMRGFVDLCKANGMIKTDPLVSLKLSKMKVKGHHTWTVEEVTQYRQHHDQAPRRDWRWSCCCKRDMRAAMCAAWDGSMSGGQDIHETAEDRRAIRHSHTARVTCRNRAASDGRWPTRISRHRARQAVHGGRLGRQVSRVVQRGGLEALQCARGLRKAAAVHHALDEATAPELMAWFGWKTIGEAQRYIEEESHQARRECGSRRVWQPVGKSWTGPTARRCSQSKGRWTTASASS